MPVRSRALIGVVPVLAAAAALTGCFGSSSKSSSAAQGATATSSPATTAAAATATTLAVQATSGGAFCNEVVKTVTFDESMVGQTPTALKASIQQEEQSEPQLIADAPSSLKSDVQIELAYTNQLNAAIAAANYNVASAAAPAGSAQITAAEQAIDSYIKSTCGVSSIDGVAIP